MKKNLIAFLIVFVSVACWQCGDKGEDDPAPDPKIEITGSPEVNLPAAGGNGVISFTTNVAWSAKVNDTKASSLYSTNCIDYQRCSCLWVSNAVPFDSKRVFFNDSVSSLLIPKFSIPPM